jgi:hypothetical protein
MFRNTIWPNSPGYAHVYPNDYTVELQDPCRRSIRHGQQHPRMPTILLSSPT